VKIKEALDFMGSRLEKAGIENAILESELYLRHNFNFSRADFYMKIEQDVEFDKYKAEQFITGRGKGYPFDYLLGRVNFMGIDLLVDKRVLIPRQETELLVESVINFAHNSQLTTHNELLIMDLGTGSGNIAISLAKMIENAKIYATDISEEALMAAEKNAAINTLNQRITFVKGDIFQGVEYLKGGVDIIVSNPPYIPSADIGGLQPEVRFEPLIALDGGKDGLEFYRKIIKDAPSYLKKGGCLFMEMGIGQAKRIKELFSAGSNFCEPLIIKDYSNIERIIYARKENGKICN
jgi:release factor glutamine methyltransferase